MSEKITFQELIESIAKETDNSKQFTHDFLKNFVDVINDGLKDGEDVNIAGFGKFKLRQVNERQGYNPQTEEKMTIPAHKKMIFKPYKDLRELINAPYEHLEPALIEKEDKEESVEESEYQSKAKKIEKELGLSPISDEGDEAKPLKTEEEGLPVETSEPFSLPSLDIPSDEQKKEEEDIVEYRDSSQNESEMDEELAKFMGTDKDQIPDKQEKIGEVNFSPTSPLGTDVEVKEKPEEKPIVSPTSVEHRISEKRTSFIPYMAAAVLLILISAGAWYFYNLSTKTVPNITFSAAEVQESTTKTPTSNTSQQSPADLKNAGQTSVTVNKQQRDPKQLVITKGETLWSIAREQFGNPYLWPWIYGTNQAIENPDLIFAGATLSVPRPSGIPSGLSMNDSIAVAKGYVAAYQWYKRNNSQKAKKHLWAAKLYHNNLPKLADKQIDKTDLSFTNSAR